MNKSKAPKASYTPYFLPLVVLLIATGCAMGPNYVYESDFNVGKKPQISFPEAYQELNHELQSTDNAKTVTSDTHVTNQGISFVNNGIKYTGRYSEIAGLAVAADVDNTYYVNWIPVNSVAIWHLYWSSQADAQNFVDAVIAMKFYASNQSFDDPAAFAEFQQRVREWQALPQKPPIPEEARRFRVLGDDAVQNKEFEKAANYYEQGLAIEPVWPAGQFNAAMIYKELGFYTMAVMHMKRYLELKPSDVKNYRDQMYIWEEKAGEDGSSSDGGSNSQAAPSGPGQGQPFMAQIRQSK